MNHQHFSLEDANLIYFHKLQNLLMSSATILIGGELYCILVRFQAG